MPGNVVQLFNPETGKITYKCKSDNAYLQLDAFEGIVKFNNKGAKAIVQGPIISLENCTVIKEDDSNYNSALKEVLESTKNFKQDEILKLNKEISELSNTL